MRLFNRKNDSIYDYLDREVDKADIKAVCSNEINEIKFLNLALYIVSTYISSAISSCEFKVYNKGKESKDTIYYKLNVSPNPNDTSTRLKYNFVKQLVQEGETLVVNYKNNLYFADSYSRIDKPITGHEFESVSILNESLFNKKFTRRTSFYFEFDNEKVKDILNTINERYKDLVSCATKAYKKAINNKWKLKIDSAKQHDPKFQEEFDNYVQEQLKSFLTGDEGVYPELNGYTLEHLGEGESKTDSSDIRNLRKDIFDMVAQAFKMPVSMMYGNITNLKEVVNQFIAFAVKPYAKLIGEEITRTLYSEKEILDGTRVEVDMSSINYRDIFDIATGIDKLISTGVTNIDEARHMVSLPIIDSEFSKQYWMTKNYSKIEAMMSENQNTSQSNDNADNNDNNSDNTLKGGDIDEG